MNCLKLYMTTRIEAVRDKIARKAAARTDYTTNVISTARNRSERAQGYI